MAAIALCALTLTGVGSTSWSCLSERAAPPTASGSAPPESAQQRGPANAEPQRQERAATPGEPRMQQAQPTAANAATTPTTTVAVPAPARIITAPLDPGTVHSDRGAMGSAGMGTPAGGAPAHTGYAMPPGPLANARPNLVQPSLPTVPMPSPAPPPPPVVAARRVPASDDTPANAPVAIDPNGRFATTYRPGGAYLSAFEAALSQGTVPESARELVGDLGARYAPAIDPPTAGALSFRVDLERGALPPSGGRLRVRIGLRSTATAATARPTMSVHVVLDASGSMSGQPIEDAKTAARSLVERLQPGDTFSLVRFSSDAEVLVPAGPVGPRRDSILQTIQRIYADGGTNISAGLSRGYEQVARGPQGVDIVKLVMLLSDGRATEGVTDGPSLAGLASHAFQDGVQTSSFGIGTDYDGPLMSTIADQGSGGYYYVRDTARIAAALATELDARVQPVAQALEVRVRLRPDVRLVQTYGSRRLNETESAQVRTQEVVIDNQVAARDHIVANRQNDLEGGMRFFIPGFARDDRHVILLGLELPPGMGDRPIGTVELRYKDRILNRNITQEMPVRARYADSDEASLASVDASVVRTVQGFDAGETLVAAARAIDAGARDRAATLLTEREGILTRAAQQLGDPRLGEDAARVARFRELVQGSGNLSEPLVLALLMDTSARGYMH